MATIIDLRGANGAGKSTVPREIIERHGAETKYPLHNIDLGKSGRYVRDLNLLTVGHYGGNKGGGAEKLPSQNHLCGFVRDLVFGSHVNVLFESIMASTIFARYLALSRSLRAEGHQYIWAYLDTPLETCLARVQTRNGGKKIKRVVDKYRMVESTKAQGAGRW